MKKGFIKKPNSIIAILLIGLLLSLIGCAVKENSSLEEREPEVEKQESKATQLQETVLEKQGELCSNSKYSTEKSDFGFSRGYISLTDESQKKFEESGYNFTEIADLACLEYLFLCSNRVTDISGIEKFPNLKKIILEHAEIDDISLLANLKNLEDLDLADTPVTDISSLKTLGKMKHLNIMDTEIEDISVVSNMPELETLFMTRSNVSDLSPLSRLGNLRQLWIQDTQVRDISPIMELDLEQLIYTTNDIPEEQIEKFRGKHPKCDLIGR